MDLDLGGRRAWVIGGSAGLGLATARALLSEGAAVTVSSRPGPRLDAALVELRQLGEVEALPLDVQDAPLLEATARRLGRQGVEMVVMSGGGPAPTSIGELTLDALDDAYRLLLRPAAALLAGIAKPMRERRSGRIAFITSSGATEPIPRLVTSNAMRVAVTSLAKAASQELGRDGVQVLCVAPGRIATERVAELDLAAAERLGTRPEAVERTSVASIPAGRYGDPDEFGRVTAFLVSPVATYVSGVTVLIDGGRAASVLA